MSKKRLAAGAALVCLVASRCCGRIGRERRAGKAQEPVKLGFITKFPVDFYFTLVGGAKSWQKTHPNVSIIYAQGKSATDDAGEIAAIQDMVASAASRGSRSRRRARRSSRR